MKAVSAKERLIVWLAQGMGVGQIAVAPGTWGSALGLVWFAMLLALGNWWLYAIGTIAAVLGAVYICGQAEEILQKRDPSSVVLDEIVAMPICMIPAVIAARLDSDQWLQLQRTMIQKMDVPWNSLYTGATDLSLLADPQGYALWCVSSFMLFRVFDIWKPWPVRQSQSLPGGWGVTMDDVLAAVYVNVVSVPVLMMLSART